MKLLKMLFKALAVLSLTSAAWLFYRHGNEIFIFDRLVLGYPEMFLSMLSAWIWTYAIVIIGWKEDGRKTLRILEITKNRNELADSYNKLLEAELFSAKEIEKLKLHLTKSLSDGSLMVAQGDKINTLEEALKDISAKYSDSIVAINEHKNIIEQMSVKNITFRPDIFKPKKHKPKSKPKKTKKK